MTWPSNLRRSSVIALSLLVAPVLPAAAQTQSVNLRWDANPEPDLAGYLVKYGTQSGVYTVTIDVGNRTSSTISGLLDHHRYYFAVQAYNTSGLISPPSGEVSNDGVITRTTAAALPDQSPDITWRHSITGELLAWHLNGATVVDTRKLSIERMADLTWKVVGAGDLNGDGYTDLVWRNDTDGRLVTWLLQNNQVLGTLYLSISQIRDPHWRIRAVGDVNGDGRADLIWQHDTVGTLLVWLMNGTTVLSFQHLSIPTLTDLNWKITGAGDVNGDGKADIIWRNQITGGLIAWLMNGPQMLSWNFLTPSSIPDQNWKIRAVRDVNSDGSADLIWQNTSSGAIVVWYMRTFQMMNWSYLSPPVVSDTNWVIVGGR